MDHDTAGRIRDARTREERDREFLPGMGKPWLLPLYDLFSRFSQVRPVHDRTAALADVAPGESVLDVGCGTANLSLAVFRAQPGARVTGLDPDGAALRIAARKATRRGVPLTLVQGFADRLPAEDGTLDHIVSALALHHVPDDARGRFGHEAFRALRVGGTVTLADFGGPAHGHGQGQAQGQGHGPGHGHGADRAGGAAGVGHGARRGGGATGDAAAEAGMSGAGGPGGGPGGPGGPGGSGGDGLGGDGSGGGHDAHWYGRVRGRRGMRHGGHSAVAANPHTARNLGGGLVRLLADAGFTDAREVAHIDHRYGPLTIVQATRP
ncbi:class I SAM-dependent methyltransferase [Promicromonospora sp. NPDC050880]|uniref:class I SAM-dependent methyltransferase n=1 Tax=Promicromonospora sp. NPDC050880 TaxID=3364406 RepID=UPI0037A56B01